MKITSCCPVPLIVQFVCGVCWENTLVNATFPKYSPFYVQSALAEGTAYSNAKQVDSEIYFLAVSTSQWGFI